MKNFFQKELKFFLQLPILWMTSLNIWRETEPLIRLRNRK